MGTPSFSPKDFEAAKAAAILDGARSAEKVVQKWAGMFSPQPALSSAPHAPSPAPAPAPASLPLTQAKELEGGEEGEGKEGVELTEEQGNILVEEWVRMEYRLRHEELRRLGEEEEIGKFRRAAEEARRRLVEEIEVEEEEDGEDGEEQVRTA